MTHESYTIVLFGASNTGKSSIINAVTNKNQCPISQDGTPITLKPDCISSGSKVYIDTPGLPKSPSKMPGLSFPSEQHPSMIWLVVNFQAAIEDVEFYILDQFSDVPVIVILNKVDYLKNEEETENFDNVDYSTKDRKLMAIHKRLIEKKKTHVNIRHIVVMSLKDEDDDNRPPVGVRFLQTITNKYIKQNEPNNIQSEEESDVTIAIVGYSSSGKSSMINTVLSDSKPAKVGYDGRLTTEEWTCYEIGQLKLWDSPAINKRSEGQQRDIVSIDSKVQPDMIWFILNYNSSDIKDEHELHSILQIDRKIPVIAVINKADNLRKIPDLSQDDLVHFSDRVLPAAFSDREKLRQLHDQIYEKWPKFMNLTAVTVTSLSSEDDDDDGKNSVPIGVDVLFDITRQHLKSDSQRRTLDLLKQTKISYTKSMNLQQKGKYLSNHTNYVFIMISKLFDLLWAPFRAYSNLAEILHSADG